MWPKWWRHQSTSFVKEYLWCKFQLHIICGTRGSRKVCTLISCFGYNENEAAGRIKRMVKFFIFMQIGYNTYDRNIQINYFFQNKDPVIFFSYLKQTIIAKLFSFHGYHSNRAVAIAVMHHFQHDCEKNILNFVNFHLCLNIKHWKKTRILYLIFSQVSTKHLSEKPMTGFSAM